MTNEQIVMSERINAMEKGIIGTTGRMLKLVTTKLWKKKKQKDSDNSNEETIDMNRDYYLCKAFLFSPKQVERIA